MLAEHAPEMGVVLVADPQHDLIDGQDCIPQEEGGLAHAQLGEIGHHGHAGGAVELLGEAGAVGVEDVGQAWDGDLLGIVGVEVKDDPLGFIIVGRGERRNRFGAGGLVRGGQHGAG